MRYILDTNMLIYLILEEDKISRNVKHLISDEDALLYTSSVSVKEFIHLQKTEKLSIKRGVKLDVLKSLKDRGIEIISVKEEHLKEYTLLSTIDGHNDPNDHVIISQAISQRIPVVSSDTKFKYYIPQGLDFVFNNSRR